jgi:hypothetical protein
MIKCNLYKLLWKKEKKGFICNNRANIGYFTSINVINGLLVGLFLGVVSKQEIKLKSSSLLVFTTLIDSV